MSGCFGCFASVFAKLAMDDTLLTHLASILFQDDSLKSNVIIVLRVFCFCLVFLWNAIMWNLMAKAYQKGNTVHALLVNSSFNFLFTGIFGYFLFKENLSIKWWIGSMFIVAGLYLINSVKNKEKKE